MPILSTSGAASAKGFGFGAAGSSICVNDGTKGIFQLGIRFQSNGCYSCFYTSKTREKYTYSTDAVTTSGVALASCFNRGSSAAGNSSRGIFSIASTYRPPCSASGGTTAIRNKYTYSNCTSTTCGVGSASNQASYGQAATGNSTRGIFALAGGTVRNKYTYACCSSTASGVGASSQTTNYGSAAGNSTRGIFSIGSNNQAIGQAKAARDKYTYADCTSTTCGVGTASVPSAFGGAAGNSTRGIFVLAQQYCAGGCLYGGISTTNKYTYASCTSTLGTYLPITTLCASATGNSTRGIFNIRNGVGGNCGSVRKKYTYATDVISAGSGPVCGFSREGSAASWATSVNCGA